MRPENSGGRKVTAVETDKGGVRGLSRLLWACWLRGGHVKRYSISLVSARKKGRGRRRCGGEVGGTFHCHRETISSDFEIT